MLESLQIFMQQTAAAFELRGPFCQLTFGPDQDDAPLAVRDPRFKGRFWSYELDEEGFREVPDQPQHLPLADGAAGTVLCVNVVERLWDPQPIIDEIERVLAPAGVLVVVSSTRSHLPPSDLDAQPLQPRALREWMSSLEATLVGWQGASDDPHTVFGLGFKSPITAPVAEGLRRFLDCFPAALERQQRRHPWLLRLRQLLALCRGSGAEYRHWRDLYATQFLFDLAGHCRWDAAPSNESLSTGGIGNRLDLME